MTIDPTHIASKTVYTEFSRDTVIKNLAQLQVGHETIYSSNCITSLGAAEEALNRIASRKPGGVRSLFIHCCLPLQEWNDIRKGKRLFAHFFLDEPVAMLSLDIRSGYSSLEPRLITFTDQVLEKALKLENILSWHKYSSWLAKEIYAELQAMPHGVVEQFQLEALFEKFLIEAKSSFTLDTSKNIILLLLDEQSESMETEKKLVILRTKMRGAISTIFDCLLAIRKSIENMIAPVAGLKEAYIKVKILATLLEWHLDDTEVPLRWIRQILLLTLSCSEFAITLWIYDDQPRKIIALALAAAVLQLKQEASSEALYDLIVHQEFTLGGDTEAPLQKRLRELILNNLILLHGKKKPLAITKEFLLFLPQRDSKNLPTFIADKEAHQGVKLTAAGNLLLAQFSAQLV
jgi:hypothetical protein